MSFDGYEPCHNTEEVIEKSGYIAELDTEHPASSVFCSHGVGTIIPWDEVRSYMHIDTGWRPEGESAGGAEGSSAGHGSDGSDLDADADGYNAERAYHARKAGIDPETLSFEERESARAALDNELKDIFEKTYGAVKKHRSDEEAQVYGAGKEKTAEHAGRRKHRLWENLLGKSAPEASGGGRRISARRRLQHYMGVAGAPRVGTGGHQGGTRPADRYSHELRRIRAGTRHTCL